jgi:FdhD protein
MKKVDIIQVKEGIAASVDDVVADECILHLEINSEVSFDVIFTPEDIKDFVYGNLFTEGFIQSKDEVQKYTENFKKQLVNVKVKLKNFSEQKKLFKKNYNIIWTECGSTSEIKRLVDQLQPIKNKIELSSNNILKILEEVRTSNELFRQTGAFHYAYLFDSDINQISYSYDIGRHNAVDKAVGTHFINDGSFDDKLLFITGRISSDIVLKCLRVRIPILLSRSAPLGSAVELAKKYNLCLIGFLRGKRFNIYSNSEAIIID